MRKKHNYFFIIFSSAVFFACKKENGSASVLRSYSDSMGVFNFTYTNKNVNAIFTSSGKKYISFEHKENYIKAIRSDVEVEYFLNSFKLPVRIVYTYRGPNNVTREANYYYKQGTKILDSVIHNGGWDGAIKNNICSFTMEKILKK